MGHLKNQTKIMLWSEKKNNVAAEISFKLVRSNLYNHYFNEKKIIFFF